MVMHRVCVFCGSQLGKNEIYRQNAELLGKLLVDHGYGLIYGGGCVGLMGVVANSVLQSGGQVIGVIPRPLAKKEIALDEVTELIEVDTMHERKAIMADRADGFIALPGGFGTCDELFEILTWAQLGIHRKPVGLLNINSFFSPLLEWLDHMTKEGFLKEKYRRLILQSKNPTELLQQMKDFRPDPGQPIWIVPEER
jgi:uncharacterized protein (TIGR00730 family)